MRFRIVARYPNNHAAPAGDEVTAVTATFPHRCALLRHPESPAGDEVTALTARFLIAARSPSPTVWREPPSSSPRFASLWRVADCRLHG